MPAEPLVRGENLTSRPAGRGASWANRDNQAPGALNALQRADRARWGVITGSI
jgi:hypothetical protein